MSVYGFFGFLIASALLCIAAGLLAFPWLKAFNGRIARALWRISWWLKAPAAVALLVVIALTPYQTGALCGVLIVWLVLFIPFWVALVVAAIVRRRRHPAGTVESHGV